MRIPGTAPLAASFGLLAAFVTSTAPSVRAQPVPIHGHTGTMALEGNVDKIYKGLNTVIVTTVDGTKHVVETTRDTQLHGAQELASLQRGTPVVVHYTAKGEQISADEIDRLDSGGLRQTEGVVTAIDRVRKTITVKYATGTSETLHLTHHASLDSDSRVTSGHRVIVYYEDESGQKVAHYFKRKS